MPGFHYIQMLFANYALAASGTSLDESCEY